jgi:hypothetical protein
MTYACCSSYLFYEVEVPRLTGFEFVQGENNFPHRRILFLYPDNNGLQF